MDIRNPGSSETKPDFVTSAQPQVCPGCSADVQSTDRFCQECGTRVSTIRTKRATPKDNESGSAAVICINCGTTNWTPSAVCSDCKIPLVPQASQSIESSSVEINGLRGSLTSRRRPVSPRDNVNVSNQAQVQEVPPPVVEEPKIEVAETNAKDRPVANKRRLPRFVTNKSDVFVDEGSALDFLFTEAHDEEQLRSFTPLERLIAETRNMGGIFSLSRTLFSIESALEKVPMPLIFLVLSVAVVIATAYATTQWNRYEQRLLAIDKIANNAEEKMRAFMLDDAINTLQELERTEKGDLPPHARSVLNQSFWLRSYYYAKQMKYAQALADLSNVTSDFVSYEDVVEKSADYKKLLARHPEFAGTNSATEQASKQDTKSAKNTDTKVERGESVKPLASEKRQGVSKPKADAIAAVPEKLERVEPVVAKPEAPYGLSKEKSSSKKIVEKRGSGSQANLLDRDMKRYSGLLVDYFSKASGDAEPPSYEEWTAGGKKDF